MARRSEMENVQKKTEAKAFFDSSVEPVLDASKNSLERWARNVHKYALIV